MPNICIQLFNFIYFPLYIVLVIYKLLAAMRCYTSLARVFSCTNFSYELGLVSAGLQLGFSLLPEAVAVAIC